MIELKVDWTDAPGVKLESLKRTWARFELLLNGKSVFQYWSKESESVQRGIYCSVFPFTDWLVENWWSIFSEDIPESSVLYGARMLPERLIDWARRHNMFFSRQGMAYPDLTFFSTNGELALSWVADEESSVTTAGHFIGVGRTNVNQDQAKNEFRKFINLVIHRVLDTKSEETQELIEKWKAVCESE